MNEKALIGVWIMGAVLIAAVIVQNRPAARRWNALQSQGSTMGTVVGSRRIKVSGDAARTGHDIEYVDTNGRTHLLTGAFAETSLAVGETVVVRYPSHNPSAGMLEPSATQVSTKHLAIIAGLVMAGGIAAGLVV